MENARATCKQAGAETFRPHFQETVQLICNGRTEASDTRRFVAMAKACRRQPCPRPGICEEALLCRLRPPIDDEFLLISWEQATAQSGTSHGLSRLGSRGWAPRPNARRAALALGPTP